MLSVVCCLDAFCGSVDIFFVRKLHYEPFGRVGDLRLCWISAGYDLGICPSWKVLSSSVNLRSRSGLKSGIGT